MIVRWWITTLQLTELFVSSLVHLVYGFYIFSSAVAGDLSQALSDCFYKNSVEVSLKSEDSKENLTSTKDLPPIVLVHGIFGFGKGVFSFPQFNSSYGKRFNFFISKMVLEL